MNKLKGKKLLYKAVYIRNIIYKYMFFIVKNKFSLYITLKNYLWIRKISSKTKHIQNNFKKLLLKKRIHNQNKNNHRGGILIET